MAKLSLCFTVALLVGMNSVPSVLYAQTYEQGVQPNEPAQINESTQSDQTATPDESTEQGEGSEAAPDKD